MQQIKCQFLVNFIKNIGGAIGTSLVATFISRFSQVHQLVKKKIKENLDDFSGKMQFTQRTINYISDYFVRNIVKLKNIKNNEIANVILNCLKSFYWNCYQNKMKISSLKFDSLKCFNENNEIKIINEENETKEIKEINDIIKIIENYLKNNNTSKEFDFSFISLIKECEKMQLNDIQKIINKFESIIKKCQEVKNKIL